MSVKTESKERNIVNSRFFYGYVIVVAGLLISIMMWGSRLSFGVFIGPLLDEFGWSRALVSAAFSVTWVGTGLLSILVGRFNDLIGPRIIMTVAGCFLGLGYFLISTVDNIIQLFIYYGVINIGMSAALIPVMSTIARWFIKRRGFMSGIVISGSGIALLLIVPLANKLIIDYGWRKSYLIVAVMAFIIVTVSAQFLRRDPSKMGLQPYGFSPENSESTVSTQDSEQKKSSRTYQASGLTLKESLRTYQLYLMGFIFFCSYLLFYIIISHFVLHVTGEGIPLENAVTIMSVLGVAGIAGRVLMGVFADRFGNEKAMITSSLLMAFSFIWLLVSNQLWMFFLFAIIFGFGHGGIATMESPLTAYIFGLRSHGAILGIVFAGDTMGGSLGPIIAGYIYDVTQGYQLAFIIATVIAVINFIAILFLKPAVKTEQSG